MRFHIHFQLFSSITLFVFVYSFSSQAAALADKEDPVSLKQTQQYLRNLSLKDLINVEVTSVSKKSEELSTAAAAIHVITQQDIRRSGVTSIPEALRLAPGLNVAKIDGNKWAISARGLNGRFSAALLVLIDGREVYNPVFSGVLWDTVDLMLEDIDRIEVIRGPGATLWGSNAVNGVINIITQSAYETQGGRLAAYGGNIEASGALRYGGKLGEQGRYRIYAKYLNRAASHQPSGEKMHDDQDIMSGGFRADWQASEADSITLDGRYYGSQAGETFYNPTLTPPYRDIVNADEYENGGHILGKWVHRYSPTSDHLFKAYYNHQDRLFPYMRAVVDTLDLDFQHRFALLNNHDVVWGLGYRYQYFDSEPGLLISFSEDSMKLNTYHAFVQDDVTLIDDTLRFIIGTKIEKPFFSHIQVQPSARLVWTPTVNQTVWGAVSRAVRNPSIIDHDIRFRLPTIPPGTTSPPLPVPIEADVFGNPDIKPETLIAYELGYRILLDQRLSLDVSTFYNDYDHLTTLQADALIPRLDDPVPHYILPTVTTNNLSAESYGVELDASWQLAENWRITGYYTYFKMHLHQKAGAINVSGEAGEGKVPQQQFSIRSSLDLLEQIHWDLWLRYVDALPTRNVDAYTTLDTRIAWSPNKQLELSFVGQNLLDSGHVEYTAEFVSVTHSTIEPGFYFKVDWRF